MSELVATMIKYLAVALAVAAAFALGYEALKSGNSANHASDLGTMSASIDQLYNAQPSFASLTTAVAEKYAPARMKGTGTTLVNPWGGAVTFAPDANPVYYDATTEGVPDSECPKLATALSGYESITINGTNFVAASGIDAGAVALACGTPGTGVNTIEYTFGH
jgi:hypothetical protein